MRLISEQDAAKIAKDPKAEVKTFYVEKAKGNTIPKHFMAEDNKDKKTLKINGVDTVVGRNKERSEYCALMIGDQAFYVRNHDFLDHAKSFVTFVRPEKPKPEPKKKAPKSAENGEAADNGKSAGKKASGKTTASAEKAAREARTEGDTGAA